MSTPVELLGVAAQDAEKVITAFLMPLRPAGNAHRDDGPLPFTLVTHIHGEEDVELEIADPIISVHTLCSTSIDRYKAAAAIESDKTHRRMLLLGRSEQPIRTLDGKDVSVEYLKVTESPIWVPYDHIGIIRKVGRYQIGLSYDPIT